MNSDHAHIAFAAGVAALAVGSLILARTVRKTSAELREVADELKKATAKCCGDNSSASSCCGAGAGGGAGAGAGSTKAKAANAVAANQVAAAVTRAIQENSNAVGMSDYAGGPKKLEVSTSVLSTGETVDIAATRLAYMHALFDSFDTNHDGHVDADELTEVHRRLGERITAEEARTAMTEMGASEEGVGFEQFVKYWNQLHAPDKPGASRKGSRYAARFKFLRAKLHNLAVADITTKDEGTIDTPDFRRFFYHHDQNGQLAKISPWHDIPYKNTDGSYNVVVEIPKWTRKKYEICTGEEFNPIYQDVKNGALRSYAWGDMCFNYGAIPQTWEDPQHYTDAGQSMIDPSKAVHAKGDNDPIDVLELGGRSWPMGSVVPIKILGVLCMIDSGETDWKLITINVEDPLADKMHDVADVESYMPGAIAAIREWFRVYKSDGGLHEKKNNDYGYQGECRNAAFATSIIEETHTFWQALAKKRAAAKATGSGAGAGAGAGSD